MLNACCDCPKLLHQKATIRITTDESKAKKTSKNYNLSSCMVVSVFGVVSAYRKIS
jgi:hypothetical protein